MKLLTQRTRSRIVRALLSLYPKQWRQEYGRELAATLHRRSLTSAILFNVITSGIRQRFRSAQPWHIGGMVSLLWLTFGMIANSMSPLPPWAYGHFFQFDFVIELAVGYKTATLLRSQHQSPALATAKAALLGIAPEFVLAILWSMHLLHPTVLAMDGTVNIQGHGITEFCVRTEGSVAPLELLIILPITAIPALFLGRLGGIIGRTVSAFRSGYRKA